MSAIGGDGVVCVWLVDHNDVGPHHTSEQQLLRPQHELVEDVGGVVGEVGGVVGAI